MAYLEPKPLAQYPWYLRWFFRRQARKYGQTLSPSWLWGRFPGHFGGLLLLLGLFQRKSFPIPPRLRALASIRIAQLNGCAFCVDLNALHLLKSAESADRAAAQAGAVADWRASPLFNPTEQAVLAYAEAMTDTNQRPGPDRIAALRPHFDEDAIVALTAWIAFQNLSAKFNAALGAEDNGLCRLPKRPGSGT